MRPLAVLLFALLAAGAMRTAASNTTISARYTGRDYISLRDWAAEKKLTYSPKKAEDELALTSRWANLAFKVNSKRAEINGVVVFLSHSIVGKKDQAYISSRDVGLLLEPVLFPRRGGNTLRTVAICAGHGGKDCGYKVGPYEEKTFNLALAKEVEAKLKDAGFKTYMIRDTDVFVYRDDRTRNARKYGADIYISLHHNCAGTGITEPSGVEVYCLSPAGTESTNGNGETSAQPYPGNRQDEKNILLAYELHKSLVKGLGMTDRGLRRARFEILRNAAMPAVLVEGGFMSNPAEMKKILNPAYRKATAQAIVDGVLAYKRIVTK